MLFVAQLTRLPRLKTDMRLTLLAISFAANLVVASVSPAQEPMLEESSVDGHRIPHSVRAFWMREAKQALFDLRSPCPFWAFGAAIVNHTSTNEIVCIGANAVRETGNPQWHGEMAAIDNCTAVLSDPNGQYKLSPAEIEAAWRDLSLYTTGEPCTMCASTIRWAGFKECIFATSVDTMDAFGWKQIDIHSDEVFDRSKRFGTTTYLLGGILANETDPYLAWQYDHTVKCPAGCRRAQSHADCMPSVSDVSQAEGGLKDV